MFPFQIHFSAGLLGAAAFSLAVIAPSHVKTKRDVALPISRYDSEFDGENDLLSANDENELAGEKDPFDIVSPEDVIDGETLDEDAFWRKVRVTKLILLAVLCMLFVNHAVSLGYTLITHPSSPIYSIIPAILHLVFTTYLIGLSISTVSSSNVDEHWPIVVHMSALLTLSTVAQCISLLVPNDGTIHISTILAKPSLVNVDPKFIIQLYKRNHLEDQDEEEVYGFWFASLVLTTISMLIVIFMRRGPERYFPPERVYTLKSIEVAAKERNQGTSTGGQVHSGKREPNVCSLVASSVWGIMFFDYTTSVVMLGYTATSLEIADLPILPAYMRATWIYSRMRKLQQSYGRLRSSTEEPKGVFSRIRFTLHVPFAHLFVRKFPALENRFPSITQKRTFAPFSFKTSKNSPMDLIAQLWKANRTVLLLEIGLAAASALMFYTPAFFFKRFIAYLEDDPDRGGRASNQTIQAMVSDGWAWVYCAGLFGTTAAMYLLTGQLWSISTTVVQLKFKIQLNTMLFAKTLVRKNLPGTASTDSEEKKKTEDTGAASRTAGTNSASNGTSDAPTTAGHSTAPTATTGTTTAVNASEATPPVKNASTSDEEEFSSKAQVMTLMTTDVDRVSDFSWHLFSLVDSPIEIVIGGYFLYTLLGVSTFWGLGASLLFMPINHWASKIVVKAQDDLMKARDERVALMNELLGGIRMLKFMAWERSFEKRVLKVRDRELAHQWRNYVIETLFNATWQLSPILTTVVSFWHYTVIRKLPLTPSIAFTALTVFNELRFALGVLPETFINVLQSMVSLRRIAKYLATQEVSSVPPLHEQDSRISLNSATITWPQDRVGSAAATGSSTPAIIGRASTSSSSASTPRRRFVLLDLTLDFPEGELSLICGKLGSGKTLLLLALLGEADVLSGQLLCPRSPPDAVATLMAVAEDEEWIIPNMCAYVPQVAWLQNASIKENILFNLPFNAERYQATLEACALLTDLAILEDGDESEIGERGVNLSGGQKARVSLARAIYSRASVLLLDDVLSAVDAHTAHHLYEKCLKGPLVEGRTVILVSHHIQLCAPKAKYIVALEKGKLLYQGDANAFMQSSIIDTLVQSKHKTLDAGDEMTAETAIEEVLDAEKEPVKDAQESAQPVMTKKKEKAPRKLVEDEARAVGRIGRDVWKEYVGASGGKVFWGIFLLALVVASLSPVAENGWIKVWSGAVNRGDTSHLPIYYIRIYALIAIAGLVVFTLRFFVLYRGSIHASDTLHKRLLQSVLFAPIRFHDTTNRGRLLNRFGKDFEGIDSSLADNFGRSVFNGASLVTTIVTVTYVGGWPFLLAFVILSIFYFEVARVYGQTARDMRRLDSVSRSPLYSVYNEAITGASIVRAFGASSKFLRDMLRCVDTNASPYYWLWGVNRWISVRFNMLSSVIIGITSVVILLNRSIDASFGGLAMTFILGLTGDILFLVRRFVSLEQSMVAVERVKEFSELEQEPPEFIEPRPPASWPSSGAIEVEDLSIRYAQNLPDVLHDLNFSISPGEKVGILGRTGSGKSTLAQSFFRFVEASEGKIFIDGIDISRVGLTDLRSRLTIIPQDPTILSGTLRTTLDIFEEYEDVEIYEALRRVHLIPSEDDTPVDNEEEVNENVFKNLDSPVSEGGENFSAGEKQLICMARAILKRTKILFMDEATASVDYATDELIGKTIRHEFADSTILTIAHRIRTIIDYDKVMVLDKGRIVEYDKPATLLADKKSQFYSLCKATGPEEFSALVRLSQLNSS